MEVFCGTSGWAYSWNPDGFDWFVKNSGLNAVELNASFYRFPFPNQVKAWARKTKKFNPKLRWSIKVNRFITHVFKFSEKALVTWNKFKKLFKPLEENIDFFLFQLPPSVTPSVAFTVKRPGICHPVSYKRLRSVSSRSRRRLPFVSRNIDFGARSALE